MRIGKRFVFDFISEHHGELINRLKKFLLQVDETSGEEVRLKKAEITLNDCLACSGCITSAESVLIAQQSQEELYRYSVSLTALGFVKMIIF